MNTASRREARTNGSARLTTLVRRAFDEFMTLPGLILLGFIALAGVTILLDAVGLPGLRAGREFLSKYMFHSEQATSALLGTLLSGLLTVILITFSVLLLAVQQTAATLTNQVYDRFLRRRLNQVYFGYSVGLAVYTLLVLMTRSIPGSTRFTAPSARSCSPSWGWGCSSS